MQCLIVLLKYQRNRRIPLSEIDVCISASCYFACFTLNGIEGSAIGKNRWFRFSFADVWYTDFVALSFLARGLSRVRNLT